jgi:hypothetical protein
VIEKAAEQLPARPAIQRRLARLFLVKQFVHDLGHAVFCFYTAAATGSSIVLLCLTPTQGAFHSSEFLPRSVIEKL